MYARSRNGENGKLVQTSGRELAHTRNECSQVSSAQSAVKAGKLRVSERRGKVYFCYAEREQVQAHEVWLKRESCE